ncbi:cell division protein FtsL [Rhizobium paknamense]|uniref:Cell division protein FtsL n=1 Tax=Rhizobium paknamense TaxID=1206817 RepID=A0ABU0I968_9HYPH|nr:hypothetical protein [Rhizobium paknamense]MDQ0454787.1 hypothetical protein [Rhizobium paknamense]
MLRTLDIIMIGAMAAAATVTYQIKHKTDDKLQDLKRIEAEIRLEHDTIELLEADWALLTQPNRLEKLANAYQAELKLQPTDPNQLARPNELPMPKAQVPQPALAENQKPPIPMDKITTGSVKR